MMKKRQLGQSGLEVSAIGFGCGGLGAQPGPATVFHASSRAQQIAVIRAAHDFGVTFFDTSAARGSHDAEALLGEAIAPFRSSVTVGTRFTAASQDGPAGGGKCRPEHMRQAAEASLKRLNVEAIDLCYLHLADPRMPIEDFAGTAQDLIRAGKVKHFGLSKASAALLRRADAVQHVCAVQAAYSLWTRDAEHTLLPVVEELGVGFIAHSPLGRGALACAVGNAGLAAVAERKHATLAQLALAWLLARQPWIVPIPGTRRIGHADENLGGADLVLSADDLRDIDAALAAGPVAAVAAPSAGSAGVHQVLTAATGV